MAEPEQQGDGFWRTLPGILTAVAALITALTGLLIGLAQLGFLGGDNGDRNEEAKPPQAEATSVAVTADPIAGSWSGEATQAGGEAFEVRLNIRVGCAIDERCGSISVSHVPCFGDFYLAGLSNGRYEFSVDNFSAASGQECTPGAGEYLTLREDGTLLYTTGYDPGIRGTLHKTAS